MTASPHPSWSYQQIFHDHLTAWGLRPFDREDEYFRWQRAILAPDTLKTLNALVERRRAASDTRADQEFYDYIADRGVFPVLYSERVPYFRRVGEEVARRLAGAARVLDFGCGIGFLTTLYARLWPEMMFVGVDRSQRSLDVARDSAMKLGLSNVEFHNTSAHSAEERLGQFDVLISTQSLFQSESYPGLPSESWQSFRRVEDVSVQETVERSIGLDARLSFLLKHAALHSRIVLFEKARHLGRRVLLQRALARRGLTLLERPTLLTYQSLGEPMIDGPLYVLTRDAAPSAIDWSEEPDQDPNQSLYVIKGACVAALYERMPQRQVSGTQRIVSVNGESIEIEEGFFSGCFAYEFARTEAGFQGLMIVPSVDRPSLKACVEELCQRAIRGEDKSFSWDKMWPESSGESDAQLPIYENHSVSAQHIWEHLPQKVVNDFRTSEEPDGRQRHIEWGAAVGLTYLYWANTYDQRQLVLMDDARRALLQQYFQESIQDTI